ncbi:MAG TPA: recombinase family protein [Candidatus Woesebacteria bacterium]|nr:recombinase family protein [Candidatus Woesebacteria bacterium]
MQVALYARVSTPTQEKNDTIESQVTLLQAYAQEYNYQVLPEYIFLDNGISGTRLDRPELERLRDCIQMGDVDAVLIMAPDRLARNYAHQWLLMEEFKKYNCQVIFVQTPFQDTPQGHLLLQVQGIIAEFEREQIKERTRRGRLAKAHKGEFIPWGCRAYGLRYIPKQPGCPPRAEIEPQEAEVVQQMFAWLIEEQLTTRQITKRLNQQKIPTKTGKNSVWHSATVRGILSNPLMTGHGYCHKTRATAQKDRRRKFTPKTTSTCNAREKRPVEEWIETTAPAIISQETFDKAQIQLAENRRQAARIYQPSSRRYLLRSLVRCGECGLFMMGTHQLSVGGQYEYLYYCCVGKDPVTVGRPQRCPSRRVRADRLDQLVWQSLYQLLQQPQTLAHEYQLSQQLQEGDLNQFQAQLARVDTQLQRLQRQLERLLDAYQQGLIELSELAKRRQQLLEQQAALDKERQHLKLQQQRSLHWQKVEMDLQQFHQNLGLCLDRLSFEDRQKLVQLLIERVVVFSNGDVDVYHLLPTSSYSESEAALSSQKKIFEQSQFYCLRLEDRNYVSRYQTKSQFRGLSSPLSDNAARPSRVFFVCVCGA